MRDVCLRLKEEWDNQGYSLAKMSVESGVPETTLRRVRAAESSISLETAVAVARVLGVSLDELTGLMPPPAAAVINEIQDAVREDLAEKYKPHSEHCATTCPARKAMDADIEKIENLHDANLKKIENLYKERIAEVDALYERSVKKKEDQIARQGAEIAALREEHKQELIELRKEHTKELEDLRNRKDIRIARFRWVSVVAVILLFISLVHSVWATGRIAKLSNEISAAVEVVE